MENPKLRVIFLSIKMSFKHSETKDTQVLLSHLPWLIKRFNCLSIQLGKKYCLENREWPVIFALRLVPTFCGISCFSDFKH